MKFASLFLYLYDNKKNFICNNHLFYLLAKFHLVKEPHQLGSTFAIEIKNLLEVIIHSIRRIKLGETIGKF